MNFESFFFRNQMISGPQKPTSKLDPCSINPHVFSQSSTGSVGTSTPFPLPLPFFFGLSSSSRSSTCFLGGALAALAGAPAGALIRTAVAQPGHLTVFPIRPSGAFSLALHDGQTTAIGMADLTGSRRGRDELPEHVSRD